MTTYQERIEATRGRSDAGYGLVGVLVAMVLLSVGVLSVSSVLSQSLAMQTMASQRSNALFIAQSSMEELRGQDPLTLTAQAETTIDEDGRADPNGIFTHEVTVTEGDRNLLEVVVIVTAPRSDPIRLVTWIYDGAF